MTDLKPCPFCGEEPCITDVRMQGYEFFVGCYNDDCLMRPRSDMHDTKAGVVLAWNRRAQPAQAVASDQSIRDALTNLLDLIDTAGLINLSKGVQLGATSWYVKASDAVALAKQVLSVDSEPVQAVEPAECGSYAINHHSHGRDGSDGDLCDVCYWRKRATPPDRTLVPVEQIKTTLQSMRNICTMEGMAANGQMSQAAVDYCAQMCNYVTEIDAAIAALSSDPSMTS